ncbi:MAG TPA: GNAT family protein [Deinococcales bacterium]|nr:GNAT family protein [Deinococcales bacterium]
MLPTLLSGPATTLRPARFSDGALLRAWRDQPGFWCPQPSLDWPPGEERLEASLHPSDGQRLLIVSPHDPHASPHSFVVVSNLDWKNRGAVLAFGNASQNDDPLLEALEVLARFAYRELGLERLESEVRAHDDRASHLLAAAGFTREAVKRQAARSGPLLADSAVWARLRGDIRERA